jgi:outer membrane PBP1 activator LpoA protein
MQRFSFWLLILATLYVSACTTATRQPAPVIAIPAPVVTPAVPGEPDMSVLTPAQIEVSPLPFGIAPLPPAINYAPHIALILPLKSTAFATSAAAVRQGFLAAADSQAHDYPIRIYNSVDESRDVIEIYRQALANGAVAVAGPLTRTGVSLLASYPYIPVPTLALNVTEQKSDANKLFFFGLIPEEEARQIAKMAFANNLRDVTIINTGTTISNRISLAFADEWRKLGGRVNAEVIYRDGDDSSLLMNLPTAPWLEEPPPPPPVITISSTGEEISTPAKRVGPPPVAPGNVAFIAGDKKQARYIRPYLNPSLPVYGTSQLYDKNADTLTNYDLNDIHFVDMPWLLQPDHPAVMIYPKPALPLDTEKDRLYAFGIDAYRLLNMMLNNKLQTSLPLDGVTGRIHLVGNLFQRDGTTAIFRYGRGLTPDTLAALEAEKAAAKAADIAARKAAAALANVPLPAAAAQPAIPAK